MIRMSRKGFIVEALRTKNYQKYTHLTVLWNQIESRSKNQEGKSKAHQKFKKTLHFCKVLIVSETCQD